MFYWTAPDPDEKLENTGWQGDEAEPEYTQEELEAAFIEAFCPKEEVSEDE